MCEKRSNHILQAFTRHLFYERFCGHHFKSLYSPVHLTTLILPLLVLVTTAVAQKKYSAADVFAHNDYEREVPFYTAYNLQVGYIEADVFLEQGDLMVAHARNEIAPDRTLKKLYLEPLRDAVRKNNGRIYTNPEDRLTFMIDLKTEGVSTLNALVQQLESYPDLTGCRTLRFMISGSVPAPEQWKNYPPYIYFDGRPGIQYTSAQWKRISMISTGFTGQIKWDGKSPLSPDQRVKIDSLKAAAHQHRKPFRFWATPDFEAAWEELMSSNMDVIVTDDVESLVRLIERKGE
jgi:alkaline phosphatase